MIDLQRKEDIKGIRETVKKPVLKKEGPDLRPTGEI